MPTKVTSNGRVTVPKRVRDYLGIEPGTEVAFRRAADGSIVIERADGTRPPSRLSKVVGSAGPGPSTDEIMALLRAEGSAHKAQYQSVLRRFAVSNECPMIGGLRSAKPPLVSILGACDGRRDFLGDRAAC
jgi:AbrB family looped-hinge helix DNA binding protein